MKNGISPRGYAVITASFLTIGIGYTVRYGYGLLLPGMLQALQITKTQAGLISSAYFIAYTLCSPFVGTLSDRTNPRLLISFFTGVLASGTVLMGYASSLSLTMLCFAMVGVGHAACWAPVVSQVQLWVPEHNRGTVLGIVTTGSSFGVALLSLGLPGIDARWGYRGGWLLLGAVGFGVAVLNYLLVRQKAAATRERAGAGAIGVRASKQKLWALYRVVLLQRRLWLLGCSYGCVGFTVLVPLTFLNVYATEELQLNLAIASSFFTVIAIAALVGKILLGLLSDKLGRLITLVLCGGLLAVGCTGAVALDTFNAKLMAISLFGLGFGAVWPLYAAAAVDFFGREQAGTIIGLWTVFLGVGSVVSPILCGWTIDLTGHYSAAFYLGGLGGLVAIVFVIPLMRKPPGRMPC
jgi:sugar phosphate permease